MDLADFPGLCVRHLQNGGRRVQATTKVGGVELCAACARAKDVLAGQSKDADATFAGRKFHKHARNCPPCLAVISAEEGTPAASPLKLCGDGKRLWVTAVEAAKSGEAQA
jgi:hypothetical protein